MQIVVFSPDLASEVVALIVGIQRDEFGIDIDLERYLGTSEQLPSALACEVVLEAHDGVLRSAGVLCQTFPEADPEVVEPISKIGDRHEIGGNLLHCSDCIPVLRELPDESIDVVISNGVLNLSARKSRALAEMFRLLRPGGRICMADLTVAQGQYLNDWQRSRMTSSVARLSSHAMDLPC